MIEFSKIVYLDLQKTGTTSISGLLRDVVNEPEVRHGVHGLPVKGHDRTKFHFISIRNPLGMYISLFNHGAAGLGGLRKSFERKGLSDLYDPSVDGFLKWLDFILEEDNARHLFKKYSTVNVHTILGPLSYRFLMLSIVDAIAEIKKRALTRESLWTMFEAERLYQTYVRTESLVPDLFKLWPALIELGRVRRRFRSIKDLEAFQALVPKRNVSKKVPGLTSSAVPDELKSRVRDREWLIYEAFGYDESNIGLAPPSANIEGPASNAGVTPK